MSEFLGLGVADRENRWIGVRRHQAALVICGLGLVGEWITQTHGTSVELVVGVALLACAIPTSDGLTIGERVRIAVDYLRRSRWTTLRATLQHSAVTIAAHGESTVRGFELQHRGRLDLSGHDQVLAQAMAEFADGLATSDEARHFSLHVRTNPMGVTTLLVLPKDVSPPSGWKANCAATLEMAATNGQGPEWILERWAYVRGVRDVVRVLRIRDFSAAPDGDSLLERIQFASPSMDVVVHVDVVGGVRAHRLAARAVHRVGSDDATSQAAGFRRTAQSSRALERLRQREMLVVEGSALLRIAVFVVVRAPTLQQLRKETASVTRSAFESGLRCESGVGRQASWYCAQLPGAPGW
jgi:hypothetical protein